MKSHQTAKAVWSPRPSPAKWYLVEIIRSMSITNATMPRKELTTVLKVEIEEEKVRDRGILDHLSLPGRQQNIGKW